MGIWQSKSSNLPLSRVPSDYFGRMAKNEVAEYKVVEVDFFNPEIMICRLKSLCDKNLGFATLNDVQRIQRMLAFYTAQPDLKIYEKTDYLCDVFSGICFKNNNAKKLREIYDGANARVDDDYCSRYRETIRFDNN
jgi:hypothetical protein